MGSSPSKEKPYESITTKARLLFPNRVLPISSIFSIDLERTDVATALEDSLDGLGIHYSLFLDPETLDEIEARNAKKAAEEEKERLRARSILPPLLVYLGPPGPPRPPVILVTAPDSNYACAPYEPLEDVDPSQPEPEVPPLYMMRRDGQLPTYEEVQFYVPAQQPPVLTYERNESLNERNRNREDLNERNRLIRSLYGRRDS